MNDETYSCDSYRDAKRAHRGDNLSLQPTRRGFLLGLGLSAIAWAAPKTALSQVSINPANRNSGKNILVSIFLRGGADGLNIVVPYGEDAYHRNRPTLGLKGPRDGSVVDIDGFFGLHSALRPMKDMYDAEQLAIVHAVGSGDQTRSHFEAMNTMERGLGAGSAGAASGWIARYLAATEPPQSSPLRAVAFGSTMPDSLRGATDATAINGLEDFRLDAKEQAAFRQSLAELYGSGKDAMSIAGTETLQVLDSLNRLDVKSYKPGNGATYPDSDLARALKQVALLIRADVGLEVAVLDKGGWDTHVAQSLLLTNLLTDLAGSLAAFHADLGSEMSRVTLTVQTEFGRRVGENSGVGTDHGRASAMFLLGGGVRGGKIYGDWPGLEEHQLEPPGDLRVTTDYRAVLGEALQARTGLTTVAEVFPNFVPKKVGIF